MLFGLILFSTQGQTNALYLNDVKICLDMLYFRQLNWALVISNSQKSSHYYITIF